MEKVKAILCMLLAVILLAGCGRRRAPADGISILYLSAMDKSYGGMVNSATDAFIDRLKLWEAEHPGVTIQETPRENLSDISSLARLGKTHLPDVFISTCQTGRLLADSGLVLDLSPYMEQPDISFLPFSSGDSVYAFPTLLRAETVILYDRSAWDALGYAEFPKDWESLLESAQMMREQNERYVTTIGLDEHAAASLSRDLLSVLLAEQEGVQWFDRMIAGDRSASFTDSFFTEKLSKLQEIRQSAVFEGQDELSEKISQDFIKGKCPAVMVNGLNLYRVMEDVRAKAPELYERLGAAAFPQAAKQWIPLEWTYGLFINARLEDEPEKLALCLDLCRSLAFCEGDARETDRVMEQLRVLEGTAQPCRAVTNYLNPTFWSTANARCFKYLSQDENGGEEAQSPGEYAAKLQNTYEEYHLNAEDYSKRAMQFDRG